MNSQNTIASGELPSPTTGYGLSSVPSVSQAMKCIFLTAEIADLEMYAEQTVQYGVPRCRENVGNAG